MVKLVQCNYCDSQFQITNYRFKLGPPFYCTRKCSCRQNNNRKGTGTSFYGIIKVCPVCEKSFINKRSDDQQCCTLKCRDILQKKITHQKYQLLIEADISPDTSVSKAYKEVILERDDFKCVLCNQNQIHNGLKLTLQLDHIDGDAENNKPSNLRILCPNCHSQTETFGSRNSRNKNSKRSITRKKYLKRCYSVDGEHITLST